jgi:hypothetical protein
MYRRAKSITGKRPYVLVSEGMQNINQAFKDEFFTRRSRDLVISNLEYRVITIATRWSGSMAKLEADKKSCED